ncbi:glycosyltransferase, partial [Akkermansiaceae bacterium]|nr:glycosyltransferase [Akkermansiaceae bacterium]
MNRLEPGSCVIITRRADAAERAEAEDELLVYRRASRNPFALPLHLERDLRENRHGIDGVVLHGVYNPPNVGMSRLLCRLGIPYIFLPHDPYPPALQNHHRFRKLVYWKLFEERMIKRAAAVQLLDEGHEAFLRNLGCQVPIFSHPNGCESETLNLLKGRPYVPGSRKIPQLHYLGR